MAVAVTESSRLQKVLQHPAYKTDPIQAVMNHLMNTMPAAPQQQQQRGTAGQQKKRKKKSKQQSDGGEMDMQD